MSKRWLGPVTLLLLVAWSGLARAAIAMTPDPLVVTDVVDGATASTAQGTLAGNGQPGQVDLVIAAGCAGTFTLSPDANVDLASDQAITVSYAATASGTVSCTVDIVEAGTTTSVGTFQLQGTGLAPHATPTPATLTFANVEVGQTASAQTLTVTNTGTSILTIASADLAVLATDYLVMSGTTGAQATALAPGMSASWGIACRPTTHGARNGTFRIVSDSDGVASAHLDVPLTCTGQQGVLAVAPASFTFPATAVGASVTQDVTLSNTGNVAVNDITAALSAANAGYSVTAPTFPLTSLGAGASVTVTVRFAPMAGTDGGPITVTFAGDWGAAPTAATTTLAVDGDGLTAGFDVTPPTVDFGAFRFDQTPTRRVCVVNTSQAPVKITALGITPTAPTETGEFAVTAIFRRACDDTGGTSVPLSLSPAPSLAMGESLELIVTADPADRTGLLEATLTVTSDLAANPTRTIDLTGTSTTATLATDPGLVVDFGAVDLHAGPATRMITITNTGAATLDLTSFARTANPQFTATLPAAAQAVAPGASITIPITYTPTAERAAGQEESFVISHDVGGVLGGPASQLITIQGRGVDRHVELGAPPAFPDTFRNPGAAAPVLPVTVRNTGDAVLAVTAVMVTSDPVWQLLDASPVAIPAQGSHDFMVRFSPTAAGPAPAGELVLVNDDDGDPMATMTLTGNGLNRNVVMGDPVIDLGRTAIGVPVTRPGAVSITSMDPAHTFRIAALTLEDGSVFAIADAPAGRELAPGASLQLDVTFTPTAEGAFETRAALYLDDDPTPQAEVILRGTAVFTEVSGGGGCAAAGDGAGAAAGGAMVILLGVVALRRRRRATAAVLALGCAALPATARAQPGSFDLDLALFNPTPATTGINFQLQPASVGAAGDWVATATLSHATNPLVLRFAGSEHLAISRRTMMELGAAYAFLGRFEAGLRMPLYSQDGDGSMLGVASPSGTARGDLVAHVRAQLWRGHGASDLALGASLSLTLPTASDQQFAGVDKPSGRALGLVSLTPAAVRRRLTLTANLGVVVRDDSQLSNIEQGSGAAWGVGVAVRALDALWATGELFGDVLPGARRASPMAAATTLHTSEYLVGLAYRPDRRVQIGAAVGRGLVAGLGTPDLRGVVSLSFAPGSPALEPIHPPPPPPVDGDADGDAVRDSKDRCRDDAEDQDGFADADGCPDHDNDGDRLADAQDACPGEAEDLDGFQDRDGCPDPDNDEDGIVDARDACPTEAEDQDGFQDRDGCADPDNDADGLSDGADRCPVEPETINGNADDDGCPDPGDGLIVLTPSALEMLEPIKFQGARIAKESDGLLGQIAATLRARPELLRVKIAVHVQPTHDPDRDLALSEKRAQAVRDWMITWGIAPGRIRAQGLGSTRPLVPVEQKRSALINNRVQVIILEK